MREILFRGKQVFLNDWIEGTGIFNDGINTWLSFNEPEKAIAYGLNHKRVHAETIGQFTGLTNKNGKVFDGDILKSIDGIFLVCWDEEKSAFVMRFLEYPYETLYLEEMYDDAEIIGNIHDNPELLENP
jgi:hypothetical protein